ncbi:MAG: glycosyltransferase family 39 protein, partial [Thermoleophilia bacterium]|nr:glycosyltransferase family 39 protein [Thermoleophilia bacterium]
MDSNSEKMNAGQKRMPSWLILGAIVLAAFVLRILMVLTRPMVQLDETIYARMAENLINGLGYIDLTGAPTAHFSPLFPKLMAVVSMVLNDYVVSGYAVAAVFGSLIMIPTYLLGKSLINERVGLMAAALLAVLPLFVDYSSRIYGENVYVFLLMFFLYFSWNMLKKHQLVNGALAGVFLGIAYLANPSTVFYFVTLAVLAAVVAVRQGAKREMVKPMALFLVAFSIFAIPYLIFLHDVTGKWTYTGKESYEHVFAASRNLRYGSPEWEREAGALTEDGRESWVDRSQKTEDLITFFINHPRQAASMFANQSQVLYTEQLARVMPLWLLPLIGLGLFSRDWDRRRAAAVGYMLLMMSPALIILAMYA